MQNPLQFPFQFSPILANLPFDLSSLHHHHHSSNHGLSPGSNPSALLTINPLHSNNSSSSVHSSTSDSSDLHAHSTHVNSLSPSNKSPSPHHHHHHSHPHLDAATAAAMSRLLFPQSLLAHSLCGFSPPEETISAKDKYSKRASVSSKSFTIDSLLGLNNAAARAVMQGGIVPPHHHQHLRHHNANVPMNGVSLPTSMSGGTAQPWKKSDVKDQANHRYHPYHPNASLNNNHVANANPSAIHPHGNANGNHQVHSNQAGQIQSTNHQSVPLSTPKVKLSSHNAAPSSTEKSPEASSQSSRRVAKAKRVRTIFTPEQLERLEAEFERQQYMVGPERLYLASSLHLTEAQVKVWFQNRRIKWRKQHLEMQQQRLAAFRSQSEEPEDESGTEFDGSSSPTPTDSSATFANDLSIAQTSPNSSFSPHSSLVSGNQHVREHFVLSQDAHDRESSASPKQLQESFSVPTDRRHSVAVGEFS